MGMEIERLFLNLLSRIYRCECKVLEMEANSGDDWLMAFVRREPPPPKPTKEQEMERKYRLERDKAEEYLDCIEWMQGGIIEWVDEKDRERRGINLKPQKKA